MNDIREMMLDHREFIKKYLMTDLENSVYQHIVDNGDITSVELSEYNGIPVRTASDILRKMKGKGWLVRMEGIQSTGGKMFIYKQTRKVK